MFWKRPPTSLPPVRGEGLENITFPNRFRHIMQFLTNIFDELSSPQAPTTEPGVTPTPKEPFSWHHQQNIYMQTYKTAEKSIKQTHSYTITINRAVITWQNRCHNSPSASVVPDIGDPFDDD